MKKIWKQMLSTLLIVILIGGVSPIEILPEFERLSLPNSKAAAWWNNKFVPYITSIRKHANGLSVQANAESYSGVCGANGSNVIWELNTETCELTISGTGAMKEYVTYYSENTYSITSAPWHTMKESIRTVTIKSGITSIGSGAFYNCKRITNVSIAESVKSIGRSAFEGCPGLSSVTVSEGTTVIGTNAFKGVGNVVYSGSASGSPWGAKFDNCYADTLFVFESEDKSTLLLCSCAIVGEVTIPDGVRYIGDNAFSGCSGLTNVVIPNSVISIGNMSFSGCSGLSSIEIPESVVSIGDKAFNGVGNILYTGSATGSPWGANHLNCYSEGYLVFDSLEKTTLLFCSRAVEGTIAIPDGVNSIGNNSFSGCTKLTSITIPEGIKEIGNYAFSNCKGLDSIAIPEGAARIGFGAFECCSGLTTVAIPNSVTEIGDDAFWGCSGLINISLPFVGRYADATASESVFGTIFGNGLIMSPPLGMMRVQQRIRDESSYYCYLPSSLRRVTITGNTSIPYGAFSNCSMLTEVILQDGIANIGDYAFWGCENLVSVKVPDSVTEVGKSVIENTAYYCNTNNWTDGVLYLGKCLIRAKSTLSGKCVIAEGTLSIAKSAFKDCTMLTSIEIPDCVKNIGDDAFSNCSLEYVNMGSQLTYIPPDLINPSTLKSFIIGSKVKSIDNKAFSNCRKLSYIAIADSVTNIGYYAFSNCNSLSNLIIPDSVTNIENGVFYSCSSLNNVVIPSGITRIGNEMFNGCSRLTQVSIPDSVISIGNSAFCGCNSLASITIPDNVKSIGNDTFYNCSSLARVLIPDSVISIGERAFYGCASLTMLTIPDHVTSIGNNAFYNCPLEYVKMGSGLTSIPSTLINRSSLKSFVIGDSVEAIENSAFNRCTNLTSVTIGKSVSSIGSSAFSGCTNLIDIVIPDSVTSIGSSAFYNCPLEYVKMSSGLTSIPSTLINRSSLKSFVIGDSVEAIENSAFNRCTSLTSVTIGKNISSIGSSAFSGCTNLTDIVIPDSVKSIGNSAFYGCASLQRVTIGNGLIEIGKSVFQNCSSLSSVEIPNSLTVIGDNTFSGCTNLTNVVIGNSITGIGSAAFSGCISLTNVAIPKSVISIDISAFNQCTGLANITVDDDNTVYCSDENGVLYDKQKQTLIQFPVGSHITTFSIPRSVTSICNYAFRNSNKLTQLVIDNTLRLIKSAAFSGCSGLREVQFLGTEIQWNAIQIEINNDELILAHRTYRPSVPLTISETALTMNYKQVQMLTASRLVVWTSSNTNAITVDNSGRITAVGKGDSLITATDPETGDTVSCKVTVKYAWWQVLIRIFLLGFIWY